MRFAASERALAEYVWLVGLVVTGVPLVARTLSGVLRGRLAADLVASLAIIAALVLQEPFAGLVIVLMQSGGEFLELYAAGKASASVKMLEDAAPRIAHRMGADGTTTDVPVSEVRPGDLLLVRPGELVPCDGVVTKGHSHVDTSWVTGEPVPLSATAGTMLASGSANGEAPLEMRATALASASQYARIVEMVRAAQEAKAPIQRLADRYAIWFTPLTLCVCAAAFWLSGDSSRVLAVLVVATPCPLILATPVAIVGGINRAARARIIVRNGTALELLSDVTVAVFDKTGTLTIGHPRVRAIQAEPGFSRDEVLRLAAAVERGSGHLLARMVTKAADEAGLEIPRASQVVESPGQGIRGMVEERQVAIGSPSFVQPFAKLPTIDVEGRPGVLKSFIVVDGRFAGSIEYADSLRPGLDRFLTELRELGIARTVLLSGDRESNTRSVARAIGITESRGNLRPDDKVEIVNSLQDRGDAVLMVGDGTNDAPALTAATVGIALASHGGGITAESADVVLLSDDVTLTAEAMRIARQTMRIARQSIGAGLALSGVAMVVAAMGYVPPAVGALVQEGIDIAVILNALRTSRN